MGLTEKSDSLSLSFNSHKDALNFVDHCAENANRWLSSNNVNFAERYKKGEAEVCITLYLAAESNAHEFKLIFRAVPVRSPNSEGATSVENGAVTTPNRNFEAPRGNNDGDDDFVFAGITELVQCPQEIVPSFVWLTRKHQVKDFFRDVLGSSVLAAGSLSSVSPKREMCMSSLGAASDGHSISSVIKGGSHGVDRIRSNTLQSDWDGLSKSDLKHILKGVVIALDNLNVRVGLIECSDLRFKLVDTALGVLNAVPGTFKRIVHAD